MKQFISVDIDNLIPPGEARGKIDFQNVAFAVNKAAELGQEIWQGYASGRPLPDGRILHSRTGAYLQSIKVRTLNNFTSEVFSDAPHAQAIEDGTPAYDMKRMLQTSMKVRLSKAGKRYLIIPFRHGAATDKVGADGRTATGLMAMPASVAPLARALKPSHITKTGKRDSGTGAHDVNTRQPLQVRSRQYSWGDRLAEGDLRAAGVTGRRLRNMTGMVKMQNRTGFGGGKHTQHMTFRVMSENSTGWIRKATPGYHVSQATADKLRPLAEKLIVQAAREDLSAYLGWS